MEYPIIPCTLCGSQENLQRKKVKAMLRQWEEKFPGRTDSIFGAMKNVSTSHLLDLELAKLGGMPVIADSDTPL
jgi:tRNA 2-thiocytidine biosynthesis protein TtcA